MKLETVNLFRNNTLDDYLNAATRAARWIQSLEVKEKVGKTWKIFPDGQDGYTDIPFVEKTSFYAGSAGIGFFFLRLYQITNDEEWLNEARAAADYILANPRGLEFYRTVQKAIAKKESSANGSCHEIKASGREFCYKVGPISEGQFVYALYCETNDDRYYEFAIRTANTFVESAIEDENGLHWSEYRDIVGDAGGVVYLLQVYKDTRNKLYLETARKAAAYIEKFGHSAKNGGTYYDLYDLEKDGEGPKGSVHVNFSHGSAGIAYMWACLYEFTKDNRYLKLADDVIEYLEGISVGDENKVLFPYMDHPENGPTYDKFYLGMCGGPIGATLPFKKLYAITHDEKYLNWVHRLYAGLVQAGVPEKKSWGYWGSKCICCGGPGALEYFATLYNAYGDAQYLQLAHRTADVLLGEAFEENTGLSWYGAWDRVNPKRVVSYTGFYIGAAGVAGALLKLIAVEKRIQIAEFFEYYL